MYTIILIIFIISGIKLLREKESLNDFGVGVIPVTLILAFTALTIIPIFALAIPFKQIIFLIYPYPVGIILCIPLIYISFRYTKILECKGTNISETLSRNISGIMWYGIAGIIILISTWGYARFTNASWLHSSFY